MYSFYAPALDASCVPETAALATKGDLKLQISDIRYLYRPVNAFLCLLLTDVVSEVKFP